MRETIHRLASIKIAVGLLVAIVIALAAGTIVESRHGAEAAARAVYATFWFRGLLALFAFNVACSLIDQWPWGRQRAGFALTHGSMLIILAGALITDRFKVEGQLALWEGEQRSSFTVLDADGAASEAPLPFSVRLLSFEIDYYQGTRRPAMFRSRVMVGDPAGGAAIPAVIEMNHELSRAGFKLFQSSYKQTPQGDQTVLAVSRDPGRLVVFAGYTLLMLGMLTVLGTRIAQKRMALLIQQEFLRPASPRKVAALLLGLALAAAGSTGPSGAAELPDRASADDLRLLPVQHDGRVMPLDTLAREAVWNVTGRRVWAGRDPVLLVLGWTFDPEGWAAEPIIPVGRGLAQAGGLPPGVGHQSFLQLTGNPRVMAILRDARVAADQDKPLSPIQKEARKLEDRLVWMQRFLQKTILRVGPPAAGGTGEWTVPVHLHHASDLLAARRAPVAGSPAAPALQREATYNRVQPSRLSWWILAAATAVSLLAWRLDRRWLGALAVTGLVAGFAVMTWGLATRWLVAERIPASNMYESLLFLGWGVALFALLALVFLRSRLVVFNATAMSALTMILTDCLPIDPFIHPMPPVLSGTPWLAIHVPIIMVSYSVLALGVLVAHMRVGCELFTPARRDLADGMSDMLYWYMHVGAILLIAGILTGSIWAASSWGRYWGWDPKEVWSLIAFLAYLAILHGRLDKIVGAFGVAALSIVAFWTILMTYVGVNYVLAAGLHSYGSGGSGVVRWLAGVAAAEALYLGSAIVARRVRPRRALAAA